MSRPASTRDLSQSERRFAAALHELGHGRFEGLRIERGELSLDPWPKAVRDVKFCARASQPDTAAGEFLLKAQLVELFTYIRSVDVGEIRVLTVKGGLPFSMQVELSRNSERDSRG